MTSREIELLRTLRPGDRCFVLNGRQTNTLAAEVVTLDGRGIEVYIPSKDEHQWFHRATGEADVETTEGEPEIRATLLHPEDWRVKILQTRKIFKAHHVGVQKAANVFRDDPSNFNGQVLARMTTGWLSFAASADQNALRATSIPEYLQLAKQ